MGMMSNWVSVGISNTYEKKLVMSYCSWALPPVIALPRPQLNSERVQDTFDLELRSRILHWAWLICIIYRHVWDTQCRSGCRMVLLSFHSCELWLVYYFECEFYTFFQSSCARHEVELGGSLGVVSLPDWDGTHWYGTWCLYFGSST